MKIFTGKVTFKTAGNCEIVDITGKTTDILKKSKIKNGILNVFIPGATGAITTIEYEPGAVCDFKKLLQEIVKEDKDYSAQFCASLSCPRKLTDKLPRF